MNKPVRGKAGSRQRAVRCTRLSCHKFKDNQIRLQLFVLACNLGNPDLSREGSRLGRRSCGTPGTLHFRWQRWRCRGSCSRRSWTAFSGSVCVRRWCVLPEARLAIGGRQRLMLPRHAGQRGSESGNGRTVVPAPSKGGQMGTKHGKKRRFHLARAACLGTSAA